MALLVGDFLAVMLAFTAAYILRVTLEAGPFIPITSGDYIRLFLYLSPIWLGIFALLGLYRRDVYEWRLKEFGKLLVGCSMGIMAMITYEFIVDRPIFPARIMAVYALLIGYALLILERTLLRAIRLLARHRGVGIVNTMIIGDSQHARDILDSLRNPRSSGYNPIAVVMKNAPSWFKGKHFTSLDHALSALENLDVHSIILADVADDPLVNEKVLAAAQENHCGFRFVPSQQGIFAGSMEVELFQGMPLVYVHTTPLIGWKRILKRAFDVVVSLIGIIITSPIMFLIYLALMISGGSPIYRRKRLTRYGKYFNIYKFRSLKIEYNGLDPEEGFAKMGKPELAKKFRANGDKLENDPRISRLGRFIRNSSLDELPQLFNILRGDISLVGPRALIAEELNKYQKKSLILSIKSGLTGLAAISGRKDIPFEERRQLDLYYVQNWSFWMDIKILLRTFVSILQRVFSGQQD